MCVVFVSTSVAILRIVCDVLMLLRAIVVVLPRECYSAGDWICLLFAFMSAIDFACVFCEFERVCSGDTASYNCAACCTWLLLFECAYVCFAWAIGD